MVCLAELVPVTDVEEATTHCAEMMVAAVKRLVSGRGKPRRTIVAVVKANALINLYRKERERIFAVNMARTRG